MSQPPPDATATSPQASHRRSPPPGRGHAPWFSPSLTLGFQLAPVGFTVNKWGSEWLAWGSSWGVEGPGQGSLVPMVLPVCGCALVPWRWASLRSVLAGVFWLPLRQALCVLSHCLLLATLTTLFLGRCLFSDESALLLSSLYCCKSFWASSF